MFYVDFICVWWSTQTQYPVEYGLKGHNIPLGFYADQGPQGCSQYDGQGKYCGSSTASEVFPIFTTQISSISVHFKCTIVKELTGREYNILQQEYCQSAVLYDSHFRWVAKPELLRL